MEKHDQADVGRWTDERMATLTPDARWEPNVQSGLARLRGASTSTRSIRRRRAWMAAAAMVTVGLIFATPTARAFADRCSELWKSLTGRAATRAYAVRGQRRTMPDFTLTDASGRAVRLADFQGKVVLLNFWTTSCRQCDSEIPWFTEFQRTYRDDLVVLGVSLDKDGWASVRPYMEAQRIEYSVMIDGDHVARQ